MAMPQNTSRLDLRLSPKPKAPESAAAVTRAVGVSSIPEEYPYTSPDGSPSNDGNSMISYQSRRSVSLMSNPSDDASSLLRKYHKSPKLSILDDQSVDSPVEETSLGALTRDDLTLMAFSLVLIPWHVIWALLIPEIRTLHFRKAARIAGDLLFAVLFLFASFLFVILHFICGPWKIDQE